MGKLGSFSLILAKLDAANPLSGVRRLAGATRFVPVFAVAMRYFLPNKPKINRRFYLAQRMISSHPFLQIDRVVE